MAPRFKYAPLGRYLADQPPQVREVPLMLTEMGCIIGAPLPPSARARMWWSNSRRSSSHAWAWLDAGWRVGRFNRWLADPTVTFVRVGLVP